MTELTVFSQMDPKWKNTLLGAANDSTIGKFGCLLTSMAMVASRYGFEDTPESLNDKMKAAGGFQGAYVIPAIMPQAVPGIVYRDYIQCRDQPAPLSQIDAYLAAGKPVIVEVDYSPAQGMQNHWIVLYARKDGDYLIRDPWPFPAETKEVTLTGRYGFAGSPKEIIQAALWLDGPAGKQPKAPKPSTKTVASFPVYAAAEELAFRRQPFIAPDNLIRRLALNTELQVLASDADANRLIGAVNEWLPVKDPAGDLGYVAAWYVAKTRQAPEEQPAAPPPAGPSVPSGKIILRAQTDGLALRSAARIGDDTLIKRLPMNAELQALDPLAEVRRKLGVVYEWLKVKDVEGKEGFVAAWYVVPAPGQTVLGADAQRQRKMGVLSADEPLPPLVVRAAAEGLALRRLPLIAGETLIARLPLESELIVLEDPQAAAAKIGQVGQWFHVRDVDNREGYAAAWYTKKRPEPSNVEAALPMDC